MTALKTDQLLSTLQEGQNGHCYTEVNICVWPFTFKQSAKVTKNGSWGEGVKDGTGKFSYANGDVFTVS